MIPWSRSLLDVKRYSMQAASAPTPLRLCGVVGYEGRCNDIVYCRPTMENVSSTVVFFGGDVQDFIENMQTHRDSKNYVEWNLEDTAKIIQAKFPSAHVLVVRPASVEYKTFSCFKNFVPCNNCGTPEHTPMHFALRHLQKLLESVAQMTNQSDGSLHLDQQKLILVGFSKGCVVLNQCLYEFHYLSTLTPDERASTEVVTRISDMYWLDGGHAGGKNTWITSRPLLETLTRLGINVHIHVTPYQIQDGRRPWIRKEEKLFGDVLSKLGANVQRQVHFEDIIPSLNTHFELIKVFCAGQEIGNR